MVDGILTKDDVQKVVKKVSQTTEAKMDHATDFPSRVAISKEASKALKEIARITNQKRQGFVSNMIIEKAKELKASKAK